MNESCSCPDLRVHTTKTKTSDVWKSTSKKSQKWKRRSISVIPAVSERIQNTFKNNSEPYFKSPFDTLAAKSTCKRQANFKILSYFAPPCHGDVDIPTQKKHMHTQKKTWPPPNLIKFHLNHHQLCGPLSVANAWLPANEPPSNAAPQLLRAGHHGLHQDSALPYLRSSEVSQRDRGIFIVMSWWRT